MSSREGGLLNQTKFQKVWETIHQEKLSSTLADKGLFTFAGRLKEQIPVNSPVLDLGCGQGRHTRFLSRLGFNVLGCDWSLFALKTAWSLSHPGEQPFFAVADLTRLPFPDNYFAAAICVHVLPYLLTADIQRSLSELGRVLQPGGWFYIDLLDRNDAEYGSGARLEPHTYLDEDGVPVHFSSRKEIESLLGDFEIQQQSCLNRGRRTVWEIWGRRPFALAR